MGSSRPHYRTPVAYPVKAPHPIKPWITDIPSDESSPSCEGPDIFSGSAPPLTHPGGTPGV